MKSDIRAVFLLAAAVALAVPIQSAAQVTYYNYSGSSGEENTGSTRRQSGEDAAYGPGSTGQVTEEDDVVPILPGVEEVTLSEQYHEEYGTYEESMGGQFFIYSNVGNGGFSDRPVYVDIPANLTWTMEKDGVRMDYASGQEVSAKGTYVLKLSGVVNPELPLSQQTEYRAVFRFRIQDKVPVTEAASDTAAQQAAARAQEILDFYEGTGTAADGETGENMQIPETVGEILPEESVSSEMDPGGETGGAEESAAEESAAEESMSAGLPDESSEFPVQAYNAVTGRYDIVTADGEKFSSSVPEGMTACREAVLYLGEESGFALYRDDTAVEYVSGSALKERGNYRLEIGGSDFHFSVGTYVSGGNLYTAPRDMRIIRAVFDGEVIEPEKERYVWTDTDGVYEILLSGKSGEEIQVNLVRDSIPPEAELQLTKSRASVTYLSEDIESAVLIKDGGEPQEFRGTEINTPGDYRLILTDQAGNENSYEFSLKYRMNVYAVFSVILVILLIVGGIVFVRYTKRNMKVR